MPSLTGETARLTKGWSLSRQYSALGMLLILPTLLTFLLVIVYPLVYAVYLSFFSIYTPTLQGEWVGLENYRRMLSSSEFWTSLRTTIVWTVSTLTLQVVVGILMALLLNLKFHFQSLARSLVLFPYFVSTVVAVLIWRWMFNDVYGILNRALLASGLSDMPLDWIGSMPNAMISVVLVGTWKYFPFVVIAVLARLQTIPSELYEAARIDGANAWSRFWDITLPQLWDVLVVIILLRTIWDFKEFDLIYLLTGGGPVTSTQTLPLLVYKQAFGMNAMGQASTYAIGILVVLLIFMVLYLYRTQGRGGQDA
ncbi:MAG: sugar ABC transporter permease [Rhizobiaceae bacterium]|nr:sugar ABC transporter permease [Rhizobiaceae bacterium]